jgi:NADH:ubiquinone oxidoreductase subunit 2 (subunit N)
MGVMKNDFYFAQFEIFFICFVVITLVFYTYLTTKVLNSTYNYLFGKKLLKQVFIFGVIVLIILAWNTPMETYYLFFGFYQNNPFTNVIRIFICILFLIFLIGVRLDFDFEFWVLMALSVFSSILILNAADMMSFFFAIELQSLTLYILVATKQNSALSTEAALKYFTIGSFSSTLMLFGISFLYGVTGLISFNDLRLFMSYNYNNLGVYSNLFILGFSLFLVGILFKVGAAPFHI